MFMESGRHFANSLSEAAKEQELGPRRDVDAGTSHSHLYTSGLGSLGGVGGN